jgi:hypothetical protein
MSLETIYRLGHLPTAAPYWRTETSHVVCQGITNCNFDLWCYFDVMDLKCISTGLLVLRDLNSWLRHLFLFFVPQEFTAVYLPMRLADCGDTVTVQGETFRNAVAVTPSTWGRHSDSLRTGRSGDRIPVAGEIFRPRSDRPWGPPRLLYNAYRSLPGVERPGRGIDHPPPSSAEVKERVELYSYLYVTLSTLEHTRHCFTPELRSWKRKRKGINQKL